MREVLNLLALTMATGLETHKRPRRDLTKGCGKAKRKERKKERQNRKKARARK